MQETIIAQGLDLMFTGMGTVVMFLAVLVVLTKAMSGFITRFFPEPEPVVTAPKVRPASSSSAAEPVDATTLQVIRQAITEHRTKKAR